ncbi:hypothetical protein PILCRDRAFT_818913 [Piloderma croceum F 1598]|uniref:Uncharacterized protein n=1 Tax=Piloderma croceum (strain F 1598) TaxID=765440 RepID=A0A0C3FHL7_PILCF|nr:hypothetical protein PILCRDRAFT_818913 [Piloderma croceum F 1598]
MILQSARVALSLLQNLLHDRVVHNALQQDDPTSIVLFWYTRESKETYRDLRIPHSTL